MTESRLLVAIAIVGASGLVGFCLPRRWTVAEWLSAALAVLGCTLGLITTVGWFQGVPSRPLDFAWSLPGAQFAVQVDGISACFLLPVFVVAGLGSIYGLAYWSQTQFPHSAQRVRVFYGLLAAAMALLVISRNSILFLAAWETMALSAFFLVSTEDERAEVRQAGWLYLAATHLGTLCLFAMFALLRSATGGFSLDIPDGIVIPSVPANAIFVLALMGFGLKSGLMPLHIWLPTSHAMAPSHVSAIMSGVIIKMGIYGLVRITSLFPHPPMAWGLSLLLLGIASGVLGIVYAIAQRDLKRMLAYSSIENIGIIVLGLGLALLGRSLDRVHWMVLGLGGALMHVWSHALFKSLLFFCSGAVIHATHARDMDRMGGLARGMPWTAGCFLVGALAVAALPPMNGFVGELLIYLGLLHTLDGGHAAVWGGAALAAPALAFIGALSLACFVKAYSVVFLGAPRSPAATVAHEARVWMIAPMTAAATGCLVVGLAARWAVPALDFAVQAWMPAAAMPEPLMDLAPLGWVSAMGFTLVLLTLGLGLALVARIRYVGQTRAVTWDCGYAQPTPRLQYTGSSLAEILVALFSGILQPRLTQPRITELFAKPTRFETEVPDAVLDRAVIPAVEAITHQATRLRFLQQGSSQLYLLYIFIVLIGLLLWW